MRATVILIFDLLLIAVLMNSVLRFAYAGLRRPEHDGARLLAAASSALTVLALTAIYADAFRQTAMAAVRNWTSDEGFIEAYRTLVVGADRGIRDVINWINPGDDVVYQPDPTLWPLAIVVVSYLVRWLIYVAAERRKLKDAATTGAVYWSHITGYLMLISVLILVFGWNPVPVVAGSLVLIFVLLVGLAGIFEDVALLVKQACRFVLLFLKGLGREAARLSVVAAGMIRLAFRHAHELYIRHVRTPLRRRTERVVAVAADFDKQAKRHLEAENEKHRTRFHQPVTEVEPDAPDTGVVTQ